MFQKLRKFLLSLSAFFLMCHSVAYCAVTDPQNLGGKSIAMGGAVIALADDLMSSLYTNPAGLVQLEGMNIMAGSVLVFNRPRYKDPGGYDKESLYNGVVPFGGYSNKLSDKLAVGVGIFSTLGNGFVFKDYNAGGVTGDLKNIGGVLSLAPTVSYMISPKLYLGLQMHIGYAISENDMPTPVGYLETDGIGFGVAPVIGFLYKPAAFLNLGLKWKGPMKTSLEGDADLFTVGGQKVHDSQDTDLYWPQMIEIGVAYKFSHDFVLSAYGKWTDWSCFEKSNVKFESMTQFNGKVVSEMRDGLRWGLGAEYSPLSDLFIRCGYTCDLYTVESDSLSPFLVDLSSNIVSFGGGYKFGNIKFEIFYSYTSFLKRKGTGIFPGNYSGIGNYGGIEIGYQF